MKFFIFSTFLIFLVSCSATQAVKPSNNNGDLPKYGDVHKYLIEQDIKIKADHKRAEKIFAWAENHLKEHQKEVQQEIEAIKAHKEEIKGLKAGDANSINLKKKFEKKHQSTVKEHESFLKDHKKLMMAVKALEQLKNKE